MAARSRKNAKHRVRAINPIRKHLLLAIWRQLSPRNREQVITAAYGILKGQVGDVAAGRHKLLSKTLTKVLFRSGAVDTVEKAMLCGGKKTFDLANDVRERSVGRYQRPVCWIVNGKMIAPDWRMVRAAASDEGAA